MVKATVLRPSPQQSLELVLRRTREVESDVENVVNPKISADDYVSPNASIGIMRYTLREVQVDLQLAPDWSDAKRSSWTKAKRQTHLRRSAGWNYGLTSAMQDGAALDRELKAAIRSVISDKMTPIAQQAGITQIEYLVTRMSNDAIAMVSSILAGSIPSVLQKRWKLWVSGYPVLCDVDGTVYTYRPYKSAPVDQSQLGLRII